MDRKSRRKAIADINEAYSDLQQLNLQDGFYDVPDRLLEMNLVAERRHRKGKPDSIANPVDFSAKTAGKLFTCQHLINTIENTTRYTIDDILYVRTECLYAQAYANKFHAELKNWFDKHHETINSIDYAKLMQTEEEE